MSEPLQPNPADPKPADPKPEPVVNTPAKPAPSAPAATDLATLPADQLTKVFENPALWEHPRFSELAKAKQDLDKLQADQKKTEEARLTEQKKFEELSNKRGEEITTLTGQLQTERTNNALVIALTKDNAVDVDAAVRLIDRSKVSVDENGQVQGVQEAVDALKTDKSYLFTSGQRPNVGAPSNQGAGNQPPAPGTAKFKRSQLQGQDGQAFYKANKAAIDAAYMAGEIEDDVTPRTA